MIREVTCITVVFGPFPWFFAEGVSFSFSRCDGKQPCSVDAAGGFSLHRGRKGWNYCPKSASKWRAGYRWKGTASRDMFPTRRMISPHLRNPKLLTSIKTLKSDWLNKYVEDNITVNLVINLAAKIDICSLCFFWAQTGANDLQTLADRLAQKSICASLSKSFPKVTIIGEEVCTSCIMRTLSLFWLQPVEHYILIENLF